MDAPEELVDAVAKAIHANDGTLRSIARDVLAVPAIADALARDAKVAEVAAERSVDGLLPISDAEGFRYIAALYPDAP